MIQLLCSIFQFPDNYMKLEAPKFIRFIIYSRFFLRMSTHEGIFNKRLLFENSRLLFSKKKFVGEGLYEGGQSCDGGYPQSPPPTSKNPEQGEIQFSFIAH